jgi:hypothetical protein
MDDQSRSQGVEGKHGAHRAIDNMLVLVIFFQRQ